MTWKIHSFHNVIMSIQQQNIWEKWSEMMTINMAKYNYYTMHKANQNTEYQLDFVKTVKWKFKND